MNRKDIYTKLIHCMQNGKPCALATVTATKGSTPQKQGSSAIIDGSGLVAGTVGGGKTEYMITEKAIQLLKSKTSKYFTFKLDDDISANDSVICGGEMNILVDASPHESLDVFSSMLDSLENQISGVLVTKGVIGSQQGLSLERHWVTNKNLSHFEVEIGVNGFKTLSSMIDHPGKDAYQTIQVDDPQDEKGTSLFFESVSPLPTLLIAGAGHVGRSLAHLAKLLDFEVVVWDDRNKYANKDNLPDADMVISGDLSNVTQKIKTDKNTYIVIVTRGHANDSEVLKHFIHSGAGYLGMIGSRKKIADVRRLSIEESWATENDWENIHAPIGIDIHSKSIQEIAVSIAAELIQERYLINIQKNNG